MNYLFYNCFMDNNNKTIDVNSKADYLEQNLSTFNDILTALDNLYAFLNFVSSKDDVPIPPESIEDMLKSARTLYHFSRAQVDAIISLLNDLENGK